MVISAFVKNRLAALRRLRDDAKGGVLVTTALMAPALLGAAGLAIDVALWHSTKIQMQSAADAAALSGAHEQSQSGATTTDIQSAALGDTARNGFTNGAGSTSVTVTVDGAADQVTVVVSQQAQVFFAALMLSTTPTISVRAVAGVPDSPICMLVLDPSAQDSLEIGSNATLSANNCQVRVNSTDERAMKIGSNATATADKFCVTGGYEGVGFAPDPKTGCSPASDPLAALPTPDTTGCDQNNFKTISGSGTTTITAGVFCGGLETSSNTTLILDPGVYVIKDGEFKIGSNSTLTGTGVVIYLTGTDAKFDFGSDSAVSLSAPTSGDYAGVVIYADRNAPQVYEHKLASNGTFEFEGVIYLPNGELEIASNSIITSNSPFTTIIARQINIGSNVTLVLDADYESSTVPPPAGLSGAVTLLE